MISFNVLPTLVQCVFSLFALFPSLIRMKYKQLFEFWAHLRCNIHS
mgnify:CR=1 FL=1